MRSITKKLANRLSAQADEAQTQGLNKISTNLRDVINKHSLRKNDASYTYPEIDLKSDLEKPLWDAIVRIADFYDCNIDAPSMQGLVEKLSEGLIKEVCVKAGIKHGVGAYEPTVPGEIAQKVIIEIENGKKE